MNWILQTKRLRFRALNEEDLLPLRDILGDPEVMYAWEHGFSDEEIYRWIDENQRRYARDGYGYFAAVKATSERLIGLMGLLAENTEKGSEPGLGYIVKKDCWGRGLATEGAGAWLEYGFSMLYAVRIVAEIRPENLPSRRVAERLGMKAAGSLVKQYRGKDMIHLLYALEKPDFYQRKK